MYSEPVESARYDIVQYNSESLEVYRFVGVRRFHDSMFEATYDRKIVEEVDLQGPHRRQKTYPRHSFLAPHQVPLGISMD